MSLRSEIRDPGSWGQKGTGSRIRIPDPDPDPGSGSATLVNSDSKELNTTTGCAQQIISKRISVLHINGKILKTYFTL
jgi:hypothetical protein